MRHAVLVSLTFAGLILTAQALAGTRYSGHIVAIGPGRRAITLMALERWDDGWEDSRELSINLTPDTVITTVTRTTQPLASGRLGGIAEHRGRAADLSPGDYVTVTAEGDSGHGLVAESIEIHRSEEATVPWRLPVPLNAQRPGKCSPPASLNVRMAC